MSPYLVSGVALGFCAALGQIGFVAIFIGIVLLFSMGIYTKDTYPCIAHGMTKAAIFAAALVGVAFVILLGMFAVCAATNSGSQASGGGR